MNFLQNAFMQNWLIISVLALVLGGASPRALATASTEVSGGVSYVAQDYGFTGPESVPAGMTTVTLMNRGRELHQLQFIKLPDGKTFADFKREITADPSRMPSWVQRRSGPNSVAPGGEATAVIDLEPGDYVLLCGIPDKRGIPHAALGMLKPLQVTTAETGRTPTPRADGTLTLLDFKFELDRPLTVGTKTIHVINQGGQAHEVVVVRLAAGATVADFIDAFEPGVSVSPLGKPIGGLAGLDRGRDGFFRSEFTPGNYGLICFLPDITRGAPHFTRGMMMDFTVP